MNMTNQEGENAMEPMTLGQIIDVLKRKDQTLPVLYDFVHFGPEGIASYRGSYEQLALGYSTNRIYVGQLLKLCEDAVGKEFQGWKGGDYIMGRDTPVWVANPGESGGTAIVDVRDGSWCIRLVTACID
jgi:hypothetical protein